jgi:hypothetical protein
MKVFFLAAVMRHSYGDDLQVTACRSRMPGHELAQRFGLACGKSQVGFLYQIVAQAALKLRIPAASAQYGCVYCGVEAADKLVPGGCVP